MLGNTKRDRVAERREATRAEILEAAAEEARQKGMGGFTLADVARRVGMRAPSLYEYFDSKNAIYDALFAEGWAALGERLAAAAASSPSIREQLKATAHVIVDYGLEEPAIYQLLKMRPVPGFEPSADGYRPSLQVYEQLRAHFASFGVTDQPTLDLWTGLVSGLADQQLSNDPGGDRWKRIVDDAVDMFCDHVQRRTKRKIK